MAGASVPFEDFRLSLTISCNLGHIQNILYISIASTYIRSRTVLQCVSTLQSLSQLNSVKLLWVPRHQGVLGNKETDRLARIGVETDNFLPKPFIPLPLYTVYRYKRE